MLKIIKAIADMYYWYRPEFTIRQLVVQTRDEKEEQLAKDINYLLAIWMESLVKKRGEMASQLQSLMQKSEHESPPD